MNGGRRLHYYAADVGRAPDGSWRVLKDRCESPVGGGYALENRIALRNCLPDEFVANRVRQLAGFFQSVHEGHVALTGRAAPRFIVLTARPNEPGISRIRISRVTWVTSSRRRRSEVREGGVYLKTLVGSAPGGRDHPARRTPPFAIRWSCAAIPCRACQAWSRRSALARWRSTPWGAAWPIPRA